MTLWRAEVVEELAGRDLLPVLYFVFSRNGCDEAAGSCLHAGLHLTTPDDRVRIRAILGEAVAGLGPADLTVLGYERFAALLKKRRLAVGQEVELILQNVPEQPDAPRVLALSVRPQPEREFIVTRRADGVYEGEEKIYQVSPRIVRVEHYGDSEGFRKG